MTRPRRERSWHSIRRRRLAFTWGGKIDPEHPGVVFELEPEGDGCRLTLITQFGSGHGGDPADPLSTWHEFLVAIPYACDGMRLHGMRRAAKVEQAVRTLSRSAQGGGMTIEQTRERG